MTVISMYKRKVEDTDTNKGKVYLELRDELFLYLLNLSNGFTEFLADAAFSLESSYSLKMYYHIRHWISSYETENSKVKLSHNQKCKCYFELSEFKADFCIPEHYKYGDIKRRVLTLVKKELDEKSDVSFNYVEKKEGQRVVGLSFVFFRNVPKEDAVKSKRLDAVEQNFVNSIAAGYNLDKTETRKLWGVVDKYGRNLVMMVLPYRDTEIQNYMAKGKSFVDAIGIICQGEFNKIKKLQSPEDL